MLTRQDFQTSIKELDGKTVEKMQVMLAIWDGSVEDAQWMLLKVKGGQWHKFFLDVGILFWAEQKAVDPEDLDTYSAEARRTYALRDVTEALGSVLGTIKMEQVGVDGKLTLAFQDGRTLTFTNVQTGTDDELTVMAWTTPS